MKNLLRKKNLLMTLLLLLLIGILNGLVFSNQLNYGFRDVDWQVLYYFKLFGNLSLNHLTSEIKVLGVYIPESYYVGLLESLIGLNFVSLHQVTHFFMIAATLSVYIAVLLISKRKLLAFITSLIYTMSYTHAGALFQLSSGGYFITTIFMNIFFCLYYYAIFGKSSLKWSVPAGFLLVVTVVLKPERMYPLIPLILIIEFSLLLLRGVNKNLLASFLQRIIVIFLPFVILYPFYRILFTPGVSAGFAPNQFVIGVGTKITSILNGNIQLLIEPLASLGSIFLYGDHLKLLGQLDFQNLTTYIISLILNPILRLGIITFILFSLIGKKSLRLIPLFSVILFVYGLFIYILKTNWQQLDIALRIHFDPNFIALPSLLGLYILIITTVLIFRWLRTRDSLLLFPILGIGFAYLFIVMTWVSSSIIFMGTHRYLSFPSFGTSLFIAGLVVMTFNKLNNNKFAKQWSWSIFLILVPLIIINFQVANNFFNDELRFVGMKGSDQIRLKNKFREFIKDISRHDSSLFYFDETTDADNAYFNESVIIAGFEYWTRVNSDGTLNNFPEPDTLRTTRQCPQHTHVSCLKLIKEGIKVENGEKGIWYANFIKGNIPHFYKIKNFRAYRFINKEIYDITDEVLKELNL